VNEKEAGKILVYPNPSSAGIIIESPAIITACEIWNTAGQKVDAFRGQNSEKLRINVSSLAPGLYFLRIQTTEGITSRKLIR
jgi:hypothetical protein